MELSTARIIRLVASTLATLLLASTVVAGGFNQGGGRAVGGVMIDASGVIRTATVDEKVDLANQIRGLVDQPQGNMAEAVELRMISLKGLQAAIVQANEAGTPLPESVSLMAGLQRVEYVFVDKEKNDIVIAGPAEPWMLRDDGAIVGKTTGNATLQLDDLIVAMRAVETARHEGISCSIEPTAEGRRRLQQLMRGIKLRPGQNPSVYEESMKQAFGPQMIKLTGIPADSRYARTLVAADYEMKRLAMDLAESPVAGLPSYLEMAKNGRHGAAQNPRWWMACDYDALTRNEDGTAWRLSGQGVKTLTEQDVIADDGTAKGAGRKDKVAEAWAAKMTEKFSDLSKSVSVFGDLRNVMDLSVIATLITQERLAERASLDLSVLNGSAEVVDVGTFAAPKAVSPQCSFVRGRSGWVVTASGGVDINAFEIVQKQTTNESVAKVKNNSLAAATDRWWWDK